MPEGGFFFKGLAECTGANKKCINMLQRQPSFNYVKYFCVQRARTNQLKSRQWKLQFGNMGSRLLQQRQWQWQQHRMPLLCGTSNGVLKTWQQQQQQQQPPNNCSFRSAASAASVSQLVRQQSRQTERQRKNGGRGERAMEVASSSCCCCCCCV